MRLTSAAGPVMSALPGTNHSINTEKTLVLDIIQIMHRLREEGSLQFVSMSDVRVGNSSEDNNMDNRASVGCSGTNLTYANKIFRMRKLESSEA